MAQIDHFKEAESCLRLAEEARLEDAMYLIARAQVHATLATISDPSSEE